jgi:hypothetical protein
MFRQNPPTLPSWPHWVETAQSITVTGRHRTSWTRRISNEIAAGIGIMMWIDCWCFQASILNRWIVTAARAYNPAWPPDSIYGCIFLVGSVAAMFLVRLAPALIAPFVGQKSSIRFSPRWIDVRRRFFFGWRRFDRAATQNVEFFATTEPLVSVSRNTDKKGNVRTHVEANEIRRVFLRFGLNEVALGEFMDGAKAMSFIVMCEAALDASGAKINRNVERVVVRQVHPIRQPMESKQLPERPIWSLKPPTSR